MERELDFCRTLNLLGNQRRQEVVKMLESKESRALGTLAEHIACIENNVETPNSTQRKRVYVALYQSHLTKLDDIGIVDFDTRSGRVYRGEYYKAALKILKGAQHGYKNTWRAKLL